MEVQQSYLSGIPLVEVRGELDHWTGRSLQEVAHQALGHGSRLLLDLEQCPYMDSGGVAALLSLLAQVRPGGWLGIIAANADLQRIFAMVGLAADASFRCFDSRDEAAEAA